MNFALGWNYILLAKERSTFQKNTEALCQKIRYSTGGRQLFLWNTALNSEDNYKENKGFGSTSISYDRWAC